MTLRPVFATLSLAVALTGASAAAADTLRIVVPFSPGGAQDTIARWYAMHLNERTDFSVIVENRPGAGGSLAADEVANATADGMTILQASGGAITIAPHLRELPYDPMADFMPVARVTDTPMTLGVRGDSEFQTLQDVLDHAEANPGDLAFASTGVTSVSHLTGELLAMATGIELLHVPYQGAANALNDLLGGVVPMIVTSAASIDQMVESGDARVLAVFSPVALPNLAGVPTLSESLGRDDLNSPVWAGYLAPVGSPQEVIDQLSTAIVEICELPETLERMTLLGASVICGDAATLQATIDEDYARWGEVISNAGITLD